MWPMAVLQIVISLTGDDDEIRNSSNLSSHRHRLSYVRAHPPVEGAAEERKRAVAVAIRLIEAGALVAAVVTRDARDRLGGLDVHKARHVVQWWQ